jgi:hypothetical protein
MQQATLTPAETRSAHDARAAWAICLIGGAAILMFDLLTWGVNPSILYLALLPIAAHWLDRRAVWLLVMLFVPATYAGYLLGARDPRYPTFVVMISHYRLINRTLVVLAMVGVAALLHMQGGMKAMILRQRAHDPLDEEFGQILDAFNQISTVSIAAVVVAAVCVADLLAPGQFNLPILFAIPLAFVSQVGSRRILWSLALVLVALAALLFEFGPKPDPAILRSVTTNRIIACFGILAIAAVMHPWMGRSSKTASE